MESYEQGGVSPVGPAACPWLSVVIPAYNEERRLPLTLRALVAYLRSLGRPFEVVVADDGSDDATIEVARAAAAEVSVIGLPHRGKGAAVRAGVLASRGELALVMDADLSTPVAELDGLVAALEGGCAVAIGSRHAPGARVEVPQGVGRRAAGRMFNMLVRALVLPTLHDTQCGAKLFRREAALAVFERCRTDGFAFDVEALLLAERLGYRVVEVPIAWRDAPDSRVRPVTDGLRMFWEVLLIRSRARAAAAGSEEREPASRPAPG
jgi:dolichyl-phosphate beta-glucosyltransferase